MNELDDFLASQQSDEGDPGVFEEDLEPEEDEEQDPDVASGKVCSLCGSEFTEEHGEPVVCKDCSGSEAAQGIKVATFPEVSPS